MCSIANQYIPCIVDPAGSDYVAQSGVVVNFLPDQSVQSVDVAIIDDNFIEPLTEEFFGIISPGPGVTIGQGTAAIRILEDQG